MELIFKLFFQYHPNSTPSNHSFIHSASLLTILSIFLLCLLLNSSFTTDYGGLNSMQSTQNMLHVGSANIQCAVKNCRTACRLSAIHFKTFPASLKPMELRYRSQILKLHSDRNSSQLEAFIIHQ